MQPDHALQAVVPVILCGGTGRRLRPLSRPRCPKPFLRLYGRHTMFQQTMLRVRDCAAPVIILNHELAERARADMAEVGVAPALVVAEPRGRNTAPALAAAALMMPPDSLLLILPSDHWIGNPEALLQSIGRAAPLAQKGWIVAFGVRPTRPETGFGYIRRGSMIENGVFRIDRFVEKPPRAIVASLLQDGASDWNSGMFLLSAGAALSELECFEPGLLSAVRNAVHEGGLTGDGIRLGDRFSVAPPLSIDVAVMERSQKTLVVPVDMDWCDLGTWRSVIRRYFRAFFKLLRLHCIIV
ncbi:MAG: NTP transferase domain-containing protein [Micavibrio aeruginosavorus]|nr:NTP transferase domain-containing protein [Micavibrio aeruginosavorus]